MMTSPAVSNMIDITQTESIAAAALNSTTATVLGDYWPGIQIYYPPVKYAPALGLYEDLEQASQRFKKHAWGTNSHTLIFDLEDGCRLKKCRSLFGSIRSVPMNMKKICS